MSLLPGERAGKHVKPILTMAIIDGGGELPWTIEVNDRTWGIFRREVDAVIYLSNVTGVPRASIDIMRAVERANKDGA